ncbi:MAG: sugar ABC transporter ATP-binding protein [Anaerolineaceae bacterium]|nr:sugar ABC transporter ATP-binding protein [Anaerolineaceae bacterium]
MRLPSSPVQTFLEVIMSVLQADHIYKQFGAVVALKDVSLQLAAGEIRALLGANGSGKSTLVKILGGLVKKDRGDLKLDQTAIQIHSPENSGKFGIAVTYQDLSLISRLTVADNILLAQEPTGRMGFMQQKYINQRASEVLLELGVDIPLDALITDLDISIQCLVEVAKALARNPQFLILDEVTASLHHDQVLRLFKVLIKKQSQGLATLFVSHRMDEVFALCETATILRNGQTVTEVNLDEVTKSDLVFYMTGRRIDEHAGVKKAILSTEKLTPVLQVEHIVVPGKTQAISICAYPNEIVGIGGLQGQGQYEFLRALYGAIPFSDGQIMLDGNFITMKSPSHAVKQGIGFITGDREKEGIFPHRSVEENLFLVNTNFLRLFSPINQKKQKSKAHEIINQLNIVAANLDAPANSLSGGNQQKLVIGRWLLAQPKLLLLDDPTKGVDIVSRNEIHELLQELASRGMTIIFSSTENEELLRVSHRIYVFYEGRIVRELSGAERTEENLIQAMLGVDEASNVEMPYVV